MASYNEIPAPTLARLIGTPDCPVIVDVRIDEDVAADPRLIPGAICHPFRDIEALANDLKDRSVVIYCHKGLKLSQGAAAILRAAGVRCEVLQGGHVAWREANLPMVSPKHIPERDASGRTLWVTRHRPKIDRIACPWLIRRFVDPKAQFLFVAASQVSAVAERFDATPFDVEDTFWSHRDGACTFEAMIDGFGIAHDAINKLALIVRAADTNKHDLAPEAAGLVAASLGLSRMYRDDIEQLEAGMMLYDAMYRWARDAQSEAHEDWPAGADQP